MSYTSRNVAVLDAGVPSDLEVDVVVVGGGAAGFAAALGAAANNATVALVEKQASVGGTTAKSGGWFWVPNNRFIREAKQSDPKDDALRYMARLARPDRYVRDDPTLGLPEDEYAQLEAYYDRGSEVEEKLFNLGALDSICADTIPDYYAELPENKRPYGRVLQPRPGDEGVFGGAEMIKQLSACAQRLGVQVLTDHAVEKVAVNDAHDVVGVVARNGERQVTVRARRAVVIASGGFAHNAELLRNYLPGPVYGSCASPGTTGDLIAAAAELGADICGMNSASLSALPLEIGLTKSPAVQSFAQVPGDSVVFVDRYGRRVVNEKLQYNELGRVFWEWDARRAEFRNLFLFMIWDQACQDFHNSLQFSSLRIEGSDEHILRADTLPGLADVLGGRLEKLAGVTGGFTLDQGFAAQLPESVERFNGFASSGIDLDFGRGQSPIEVWFNGMAGSMRTDPGPNPTMYPLRGSGPYYATILGPAVIDTKGGPRINTRAQIVDADDTPIPGLYGAGNYAASWTGQAYWGGGSTIGPALTFGYLAGVNAAEEAVKTLGSLTGAGIS